MTSKIYTVSPEKAAQLLTVAKQYNAEVVGDTDTSKPADGTITDYGVTLEYGYDPAKTTLTLTIMRKSLFVPDSVIFGAIEKYGQLT